LARFFYVPSCYSALAFFSPDISQGLADGGIWLEHPLGRPKLSTPARHYLEKELIAMAKLNSPMSWTFCLVPTLFAPLLVALPVIGGFQSCLVVQTKAVHVPSIDSDESVTNTEDGPFFGNGFKTGEINQSSAIVWVRLTRNQLTDFQALPILTEGLPSNARSQMAMPVGVSPGMEGQVRIRFREAEDNSSNPESWTATPWIAVDPQKDFVIQVPLERLRAGLEYRLQLDARADATAAISDSVNGRFRTAPAVNADGSIRFIVSTCQAIRSIDSGAKGHVAYREMLDFKPDFFVHTGDILYYDKVPLCKSVQQARSKWNLMFSYQYNREFHQQVGSYFMKDDHDTLKNDCWPGQTYGNLTFEEGLSLFREQVPMGQKTFRTVRWGQHLQIWMTENRDFRSPNRLADGPQKTILGVQQKRWLKESLASSDATFKFVITPGPIVGPDKRGKADNHSNNAFQNEGQQLREFLASQSNTYVICGDRHWQYCSQDPETGLMEFGCGPINDEHSFGGNPGNDPKYHRYFSGKGGFFGVTVNANRATAQWYAVNSKSNEAAKLRYTETLSRKP
jgi:alkaline phosphatase D